MASSRTARGSALAEVLIAILLIAVAVSSMAGLLVQGPQQDKRLGLRELGSMQGNMVLQLLKNYVTADPSAATQTQAPNGCWDFLQGGNCPAGSWALSTGHHVATSMLPSELSGAPVSMTLEYDVAMISDPNGTSRPQATVAVSWQDPQ